MWELIMTVAKRKTQQHRLGTNVRDHGFNPGLLTRNQFASGRSWGQPARSRFSVVFLGPRAIAELVAKFHVALHASHAALPMVTLKISPWTNVTLSFDFDFGLDHPVHGGYGWASPTSRRWSNCQTKKLKSNWPTDRWLQCNLKLNLHHCTANYRPVLLSEKVPYMKNKCNNWSPAPRGAGTGQLTVGRNGTSTSTEFLE
jgi:hypothetical protein